MKASKEGKLTIWNNNRMSSFVMMKNCRVKTSKRSWKTTEVLKHGRMNTKEKIMIWNNNFNNRLMMMMSSSSSSPILKRHTNNKKKMMEDDDLIGKVMTTTTISDLSEEVLTQEVLVRLSLKDIRACVCVQKSWLSLIKNHIFITLYSNYQISSSSNPPPPPPPPPLHHNNKYLLFWNMYTNDYELRVDDIQCEKYLTLKSPPDQAQFADYTRRLVSNGLICIFKNTHKTDHDIYLWNPIIQKYKTLPHPPHLPYERALWKAIGFGFVPEINDYVVVYIVKHGLWKKPLTTYSCVSCVYSLNTNSWRKITHDYNVPDAHRVNDGDSFFVNGIAVWVGCNSQDNRIVICFDTKTDVLREILLPPECVDIDTYDPTIHPFGQSIVCFALNELHYNQVGMWVLKGDMMNEILWEKKVTVRFRNFAPVRVLGLRNNGDPILCNSYDMISYNRDSYKAYAFVRSWDRWTPDPCWHDTMGMGTPFVVKPFVESLALLNID